MSVLSVDVGQRELKVLLDLDVRTLLDIQSYDTNDNGEFEAAELDQAKGRLTDYLDRKLAIKNASEICSPGETLFELTAGRRLLVRRSYTCPPAPGGAPLAKLSVDNSIFMEDQGGHRVVAKFVLGTTPIHHVFLPESRHFEFDASAAPDLPGGHAHSAASASTQDEPAVLTPNEDLSFLGWVREGIKHILLGYDHILFVIGLVVVVRRFRELALVVTSFTLAHSLTLALGATGMVSVASRLVESLIAASIVYVAWDNFRRFGRPQADIEVGNPEETQSGPKRHYLTFAFGLVHGFGFASVLTEFGLPTKGLVGALFGFNLGVEVGQLALVAPLYPVVRYLHQKPMRKLLLVRISSAVIGGVGSLWLLDRVFDLGWMPF